MNRGVGRACRAKGAIAQVAVVFDDQKLSTYPTPFPLFTNASDLSALSMKVGQHLGFLIFRDCNVLLFYVAVATNFFWDACNCHGTVQIGAIQFGQQS
jgi:hypothetical protein